MKATRATQEADRKKSAAGKLARPDSRQVEAKALVLVNAALDAIQARAEAAGFSSGEVPRVLSESAGRDTPSTWYAWRIGRAKPSLTALLEFAGTVRCTVRLDVVSLSEAQQTKGGSALHPETEQIVAMVDSWSSEQRERALAQILAMERLYHGGAASNPRSPTASPPRGRKAGA